MFKNIAVLSVLILAIGCQKKSGPYFQGVGVSAKSAPLPMALTPTDLNKSAITSDNQTIHVETTLQSGDTLDVWLCPASGLASHVIGSCKLFQNGDGTMVIVGAGSIQLVRAATAGYSVFWLYRQPHENN